MRGPKAGDGDQRGWTMSLSGSSDVSLRQGIPAQPGDHDGPSVLGIWIGMGDEDRLRAASTPPA